MHVVSLVHLDIIGGTRQPLSGCPWHHCAQAGDSASIEIEEENLYWPSWQELVL